MRLENGSSELTIFSSEILVKIAQLGVVSEMPKMATNNKCKFFIITSVSIASPLSKHHQI